MCEHCRNEFLTAKELAGVLRRSVRYIYRMRERGFAMPGGTATVMEARKWLSEHPRPFSSKSSQFRRIVQ